MSDCDYSADDMAEFVKGLSREELEDLYKKSPSFRAHMRPDPLFLTDGPIKVILVSKEDTSMIDGRLEDILDIVDEEYGSLGNRIEMEIESWFNHVLGESNLVYKKFFKHIVNKMMGQAK